MDINIRIKNRRLELGLSQDDLAQKAGYTSRSSINKIEAGKIDLPQSKIEAIAKALQTTPAYLMGWEEENSINTPPANTLDKATQTLVDIFEQLNAEDKKNVLEYTEFLLSKSKKYSPESEVKGNSAG